MKHFNVIIYNQKSFNPYDIMPYLIQCYKKCKNKPVTFEEFKKFVCDWSKYKWWARCEYEILLDNWPNKDYCEKWDIWDQIEMNIDIITNILIENVNEV